MKNCLNYDFNDSGDFHDFFSFQFSIFNFQLFITVCTVIFVILPSLHIEGVDGFIIVRHTIHQLKKDLPDGLNFHLEGLYKEEREPWMESDCNFEYVYQDIPSFIEAYNGFMNQSSLARIVGINTGQMRQYATGLKRPTKRTLQRIESGLKRYAGDLQTVSFR